MTPDSYHHSDSTGRDDVQTTTRLLSQIQPAHPSSPAANPDVRADFEAEVRPTTMTPLKSSLRFSHPPPPPSATLLPPSQSKRARFSHLSPSSGSSNGATKPLSGIARPLSLPATPPVPSFLETGTPTTPLRRLHQPSLQELQGFIPTEILRPPPPTDRRDRFRQGAPAAAATAFDLPQAATSQPVSPLPRNHDLAWKHKTLLTGFASLDQDFARISRALKLPKRQSITQDHTDPSSSSDGSQEASIDNGLCSGSLLEIIGPPGSGKTRYCLQMAVHERLRSLLQARKGMSGNQQDLDGRSTATVGSDGLDQVAEMRSTLFAEEFWDAEMTSADQVLLVDCEGAMLPERVADVAWSVVIEIWNHHNGPTASASTSTPPCTRSSLPESVRRLVVAMLGGIHICRVTNLSELIALLTTLRPSDMISHGRVQESIPSSLPPRASLIIIDSLSHHLRNAASGSKERKQAAEIGELAQQTLLRLQRPFECQIATRAEDSGTDAVQQNRQAAAKLCAPTIVFTNQVSVRSAKVEDSGRNSPLGSSSFRSGNSSFREGASMLVPQLQGQRPPSQREQVKDHRPPPSVALAGPEIWDDDEEVLPTQHGTQQVRNESPPHRFNRLSGSSNRSDARGGHDRDWAPSFLGPDVWRIVLFRHGNAGHRFAQVVSIPTSTQNELNRLWEVTRDAELEASPHPRSVPTAMEPDQSIPSHPDLVIPMEALVETHAAPSNLEELSQLLKEIKHSLFRWRPFQIDSTGLN